MRKSVIILLAMCLGGCAAFEDWVLIDDDGGKAAALAGAESASLMDLSIATGRYSVMLGQAREILRLPEPRQPAGDGTGAEADNLALERAVLAAQQAQVTNEFLADAARACQRRRVPKGVRSLACEQQRKMPAELRKPTTPELAALTIRNDRVGEFIIEWWDAVCAHAIKPRGDDPPACSIE